MRRLELRLRVSVGMAFGVLLAAVAMFSAIGQIPDAVAVTVTGNPSSNGVYLRAADLNSYPSFTLPGTTSIVYWTRGAWVILQAVPEYYAGSVISLDTAPPETGWRAGTTLTHILLRLLPPASTPNDSRADSRVLVYTPTGPGGQPLDSRDRAGGGGSNDDSTGIAVYEVGETIKGGVGIREEDWNTPYVASYVVVELYYLTFDGEYISSAEQLEHFVVHFDWDSKTYRFAISTTQLVPGAYSLRLVFADGTGATQRVEIVDPVT